ncbi:glucose transmembrane transporter [Balamuthia mandrillaris]
MAMEEVHTTDLEKSSSAGLVFNFDAQDGESESTGRKETAATAVIASSKDRPETFSERISRFLGWFLSTKIQTTLAYCVSFFALGMMLAEIGPALLALSRNTDTSLGTMGYIFAARSCGYFVGSMFGGPLFDRLNGNRLLATSLALTAIGNAMIPVVSNVWLLALLVTSIGVSMGLLDTGGNVSMIWLHGEQVGPYMQAMHFSFGVGALVSPIAVGKAQDLDAEGDPAWAFWGMSAITALIPIWLVALGKAPAREKMEGEETGAVSVSQKCIVGLVSLWMLLYVGAEVGAGGYIYTFAVERKLANTTTAAYLTSVFWAALTIGRLLSIPISLYFSAAQMLGMLMAGCTFSNLLWLLFADSQEVLWIAVFLYGLSMSSSFPTAINLAETYMKLTGRVTSLIVMGACFGEMIIPLLIAKLLEDAGTIFLVWVLLFCSVFGFVTFATIYLIGSRIVLRNKSSSVKKQKKAKKKGEGYIIAGMSSDEDDDEKDVDEEQTEMTEFKTSE